MMIPNCEHWECINGQWVRWDGRVSDYVVWDAYILNMATALMNNYGNIEKLSIACPFCEVPCISSIEKVDDDD